MVLETDTREGLKIYIGQTDVENDALRKAASQNYLWFHLQDNPSPHVILACPSTEATPENIKLAAHLCKRYSKKIFREARSVKVIYTEIRNVKNDPKKHGSCHLTKSPNTLTVFGTIDDDMVVRKSQILK